MKIALVNLPFASLALPSLGLTQIRAELSRTLQAGDRVHIHYLNQDFGTFMGCQVYQEIALSGDHLYTGIGDWFFRAIAFPELPDNTVEYFTRFYPRSDSASRNFRLLIEARRAELGQFIGTVIDRYGLVEADVVGFTSMFAQSAACYAVARRLKLARPGIVTVIGGANCEGQMGRAIATHVPHIDYVCSGPGLKSFPELVRRIRDPQMRPGPIPGVFPGVGNPAADRLLRDSTVDLGEELPLDASPDLDYGDFLSGIERRFPGGEVKPVLLFEMSRGCWWGQKAHCTFCGLNGSSMSYRSMTPARAIKQLTSLFVYASRCAELSCVDNIIPKEYLRDVFPFVKAPQGLGIFCEVKADLSPEDVRILAEAGVKTLQPGIEALATSTLKLMRKGTSAFTNLRLLSSCGLHDVSPTWNLLVGFPGEDSRVYDKYLSDIPRLYHLPPPVGAFAVRFDRFSPYFENSAHYGLDLHPLDYYSFVYPFDEDIVQMLAYYFADHRYDAPYQVAMLCALRQMQQAVAEWRQRYSGFDGRTPAHLFLADDSSGRCVVDSRDGHEKRYTLDPPAARLLASLESPTTCRELRSLAGPDVDTLHELGKLRVLGLLFEEGERIVSVVMPRATPRWDRCVETVAGAIDDG